jgi:DNA-binding IclR family transcriptional regulator
VTAPSEVPARPDAHRTAAGRMLAVLNAFDSRHPLLSLSEIARRGALTLPTAHRLVGELVAFGALERAPDGRYGVGLRLLELSALAPRGLQLREAAFPHLDALRRSTGGNVHLGVRDGSEVVYVDAMRTRTRHQITSRVGDRWPMHVTGTGLVLLAYADPALQEKVLNGQLERFNDKTIVDPHELRRALAEVRRTGVAVAHGQISPHHTAVAVPVRDGTGDVCAAISVVVETEVVVETGHAHPRRLGTVLEQASRSITRSMAPPVS